MSQSQESSHRGFAAAADLSAKQYFIVKLTAAEAVNLSSAATDVHVGVLQNAPKSGDTADVFLRSGGGTCKVVAGGTIAQNAKVTSDASGKAIATTTGNDEVVGIALASAVSGDVFEIMVTGHRY